MINNEGETRLHYHNGAHRSNNLTYYQEAQHQPTQTVKTHALGLAGLHCANMRSEMVRPDARPSCNTGTVTGTGTGMFIIYIEVFALFIVLSGA